MPADGLPGTRFVTRGHPFGDEVILALARTMTENCRAMSHVARLPHAQVGNFRNDEMVQQFDTEYLP